MKVEIPTLQSVGEKIVADFNDEGNSADALTAALLEPRAAAYVSYFFFALLRASRTDACDISDESTVHADCCLAVSQARLACVEAYLHGFDALDAPRALLADEAELAQRLRRPAAARLIARMATDYAQTGDEGDLYMLRNAAADLAAGINTQEA